jgi:hypothetical protein
MLRFNDHPHCVRIDGPEPGMENVQLIQTIEVACQPTDQYPSIQWDYTNVKRGPKHMEFYGKTLDKV